MNEIKAFVGHSFTDDDAAIVGSFLKYFDQIKGLYPTFSWEHAEAAEPRELASKVLSLIADKNVFIGICTKKERAISPGSLNLLVFRPLYRKAKEADLQWKTSDWIIQEIGLAIGRGLDLILLVEEGLRNPGGLQGNVEYITFRRDAPEKCFGKILEMIRALSPKATQWGATTGDIVPRSADKEAVPSDTDPDWANPKPEWTREDYKRAMFYLIVRDRAEDAANLEAAYLSSDDAKVGDHAAEWQADAEYLRITFGKGGSLDKIKSIAEGLPENRDVLVCLGMAHTGYGEHREAARIFGLAATVARDAADKQSLLGFAAVQQAKAGDTAAALSLLDDLRRAAAGDTKIELDVLNTLRRVAGDMNDDDAALAVMERIVEVAPDNIDVRFSLAYKHSEMQNQDMAFYHYLKIPFAERNATTWNNLGVSFDHFSMPAKSVRCYRRAEERQETLAMSNLGYKLMRAGFLKEAQEEFDKAHAIKDYHKNVDHGLARLKDIPDEEDKKEKEILDGAKRKAEFYRLLGRAVSQPRPAALGSRWQGPNCEFVVNRSGDRVHAVGIYERDGNAILGAFTLGPKPRTKHRVEYEGILVGSQIEATVRRTQEGDSTAAASILGLNDAKTKVLMVVGGNGELKVMENPHGTHPSYYELHVIVGAPL